MKEIIIRMEREQIDVTRNGMFGGEVDYSRKFVPGISTYYVTIDGVELPPMTPEQYGALALLLPEVPH